MSSRRCFVRMTVLLFLQASVNAQAILIPAPSRAPEIGTGILMGRVTSEAGVPLAGALVFAVRTSSPSITSASKLISANTAVDGTFHFDSIPPGSYTLCPQTPGSAYLDPCQWSSSGPSVHVLADRTSVMNVALKLGAFLQVRVDDPGKLIKAFSKKRGSGSGFLAGVRTSKGMFQSAHVIASDDNGQNLRVVVPKNLDVQFILQPLEVELLDGLGKAVHIAPPLIHIQENEDVAVLRFNAGVHP